jgi:hypothetical protein
VVGLQLQELSEQDAMDIDCRGAVVGGEPPSSGNSVIADLD